jgi:excisionase family DNA binding protein
MLGASRGRGIRGIQLEDAVVPEPWVSVEDVARHPGVSKDTIFRWAEAERPPAHRVGRFWKFNLQEIDDWVRAGGAAESGHDRAKEDQ